MKEEKMKDKSKITITFAEYQRLLRADIQLDFITNRAKKERYFGSEEICAMLGIERPKKEEDE